MDNKYYLTELNKLRHLAKDFATKYPAVANRLLEPSVDPDVERLLEGVAYLGADLQQQLEEEFPQLLHSIMDMLCPDDLQPLPSAIILSFKPLESLYEVTQIQAGTEVESGLTKTDTVPINFMTCYGVEVLPLAVNSFVLPKKTDNKAFFELNIKVLSELKDLDFNKLRLYFAGNYRDASNLLCLFNNYLRRLFIKTNSGEYDVRANINNNFAYRKAILAQKSVHDIPTFNLLRDFYLFPQNFLFFEVDISDWRERSGIENFSIIFEVNADENFLEDKLDVNIDLFAVPAINLINLDNYPISNEFKHEDIMLNVLGENGESLEVVNVDKVIGVSRGIKNDSLEYRAFHQWSESHSKDPYYQIKYQRGVTGIASLLSIAYPAEIEIPLTDSLMVSMQCTQGKKTEKIKINNINKKKTGISELVDVTNISLPSVYCPPMNNNMLPHLLSHMSFSVSSLLDVEQLKNILQRYLPHTSHEIYNNNLQKIKSIQSVNIQYEEDLFGKHFISGQRVRIILSSTFFVGLGDVYIFGSVINAVLSACSPINSYTTLEIFDQHTGKEIKWLKHLGTEKNL